MTAVLETPLAGQEETAKMTDSPPPMDRAQLVEFREERYRDRCAKLDADVHMDPELRRRLKDRTLLGTEGIRRVLDFSDASRVSTLRSNRKRFLAHLAGSGSRYWHTSWPGVLPDPDSFESEGLERPRPQIETGRLLEWALDDGRLIWDSVNKTMVVNVHWRGGRRRTPAETKPPFRPRLQDGRRGRRGIIPEKKNDTSD